jgi:hypothetical protein
MLEDERRRIWISAVKEEDEDVLWVEGMKMKTCWRVRGVDYE